MTCPRVQKRSSVLRRNPAASLEPARKSTKRPKRLLPGLFIKSRVPGIQQNHMPPENPSLPIKLRKKSRILIRDKILHRLIPLIPQTPPDNLLHLTIMNINTRPKLHPFPSLQTYYLFKNFTTSSN